MSSQPPVYPVYTVYPPPGPSHYAAASVDFPPKHNLVDSENARQISRTPSPTRSEFNLLNGIKEEKTTKQKIRYYAIIGVLLLIAILISVFHEKIIHALKPSTDWLHDHKSGAFILVAILIVLSFPPLFGHELVAMLAGVTWDPPLACVVVAAGTLLGEIANYFTFKYACSARGAKYEAKDLKYGLLAHIVRNGGFKIVLVIRYSAIPAHFATSVFSTVGISFPIFLGAAVLSLPKALVPVYVGYALKPENDGNKRSNVVEKVLLGITIVVTIVAFRWIKRQTEAATPEFVYRRRKARQAKAAGAANGVFVGFPTDVV
ncbi:hypothetical protein B0H15DRAFT_986792 [Mycena belliarum]|uniref:Golgi apparatus membrane protein TVP38 n=1 Tax=Mycena belliarum TaxID=1033014 RepID=A0AAD6U5S1_9AGAR|nr:hypothetical protein B0H15DRAFT_986792 [Mycena belliae]